MKRNESIKTIMSSAVETVNLSNKVSDVRKLMSEKGIHHLPVTNGDKLVGVLSATDMMALNFSAYGADQRTVDVALDHEFSIQQVMKTDVVTLPETGTVRDAARVLQEGKFHSLPVVDGNHRLVGIVTSTDLIRYLVEQY